MKYKTFYFVFIQIQILPHFIIYRVLFRAPCSSTKLLDQLRDRPLKKKISSDNLFDDLKIKTINKLF